MNLNELPQLLMADCKEFAQLWARDLKPVFATDKPKMQQQQHSDEGGGGGGRGGGR